MRLTTIPLTRSEPEELLAFQLKAASIPFEREFQFAPPRKWRGDFRVEGKPRAEYDIARMESAPYLMPTYFLVEVDGGAWTGGRHSTGPGMERDCEKQSAAAIAGYRVIRVTPKQVESGEALKWIEAAR